ncbi:EamA family transporter RarD [Shewanella eurypsychrophilus]|uniref:EamA family transporter RarD n=1 Tax=Shewanella eurypsychrophilus TaxID=2593656 RepID=A0ABX6VAM2_9GAMM|nr:MULTISPECIES: EamA family transporter RarD [Shewanella]QFU24517.1 EamA family transporter RarD [Shewanella sp. YLB-09]QPG59715.1 EamA family transporter RarD [Shewanella eurypsychrophilus]
MPHTCNVTFKGNALAAFAFLLWGIMPLYFQMLTSADTNELQAFRITFSVPFMVLVFLTLGKQLPSIALLKADKRSVALCGLASVLMCVSWYSFTWAITHGQVLAASLGYFINPLFAIALGVLFLGDKLSKAQVLAGLLGTCGISYMIFSYGELPWLSLAMGGFFALYGLCKKFIRFDSITSVTLEAAILLPIALGYLIWLWSSDQSVALAGLFANQQDFDWKQLLIYMGTAPVTLMPLLFFALAISRTSLSMIGLMQYIEPSMHFLLAVLLFNEHFDQVKAVSFALIWTGLLLCSLEALPNLRQRRAENKAAGI